MKLIDEKEVEEAAKEYSLTRAASSTWRGEIECDFKSGFSLAEQKLQPIILEFAEWVGNMAFYFDKITDKWLELGNTNKFTSEQLLEQFLKTRQL